LHASYSSWCAACISVSPLLPTLLHTYNNASGDFSDPLEAPEVSVVGSTLTTLTALWSDINVLVSSWKLEIEREGISVPLEQVIQ